MSYQQVKTKLEFLRMQVAEDDVAPLEAKLAQAKRIADKATLDFATAGELGDPGDTRLGTAELQNIQKAYAAVDSHMQQAEQMVNEVESQIADLERLVGNAPKIIAETSVAIDQASARIQVVAKLNFKTDEASSLLKRAQGALKDAQGAMENKKFSVVAKLAQTATKLAVEATAKVDELPQMKADAERQNTQLAARIKKLQDAIVSAKAVFDEIAANYAPACWQPVVGNGGEAVNRVNWALEALERARRFATDQEWQKSQDQRNRANTALAEGESFMRSITALKQNLDTAKRDAAKEIQLAQADITQAGDYIKRYDEDIRESLEDNLRKAQIVLDEAKTELGKAKPDYLKTVRLAKQVNKTADDILVEARTEHEQAERQRQRAISTVRDATAAVSRCEEYIEDHSNDVSRTAKSALEDAQDLLSQAKRASRLDHRIDLGEEAESKADSAYSRAQSDVEKANEDRYQPSTTAVLVGGWGSSRSSPHHDDDSSPISFPSWSPAPSGGGGDSGPIGWGGGGGGDSGPIGGGGGGGDSGSIG